MRPMSASSGSPGTTISTPIAGSRRRRSMPMACSTTRCAWNITTAYDAKTGQKLWTYDPKSRARWAAMPAASRSRAAWRCGRARSIIATLDGRLIALDKNDRQAGLDARRPSTSRNALFDHRRAARVRRQGGGRQRGRRPGRARLRQRLERRYRQEAVEVLPRAQHPTTSRTARPRTGHADGPQDLGRHGMVEAARRRRQPWDSIAYDPELDLVYVGTGNGGPDAQLYRSPDNEATTCSCARSSRSTQRPAATPGTTRWCRARTGTTPAPSRSSAPI